MNNKHVQMILMIVTLVILVLGVGAPMVGGG